MSKGKRRMRPVTEPPRVRADAAGVDISPEVICVAVDPTKDAQPVRCWGTVTAELYRIANWLRACGVTTVAMESTGVYWIPLYQILEDSGFEVFLVNARHYRNVPGRKTDVADAAWLQYLHAVGLLSASFRPAREVCWFRTLLRHRAGLVQACSQHIQHMQKSLDQMNVQIHRVLSDITGISGLAMVRAILDGKRDGRALAALRDRRVKASEEEIIAALEGDYRPEHLFTLKQSLKSYEHYQAQIAECEQRMRAALNEFESRENEPPSASAGDTGIGDAGERTEAECSSGGELSRDVPGARKVFRKRADEELRVEYYRIFGVDLTAVPGVHLGTVQMWLAELGPDLSRFRSGGALASWLGLCPNNTITGGKVLASRTRKVVNRLTDALRMAAESLCRDKSYLGQYYRRMKAKLGGPAAITAAAHKLVRVLYHLVNNREEYDESEFAVMEERYRQRQRRWVIQQARAVGLKIMDASA